MRLTNPLSSLQHMPGIFTATVAYSTINNLLHTSISKYIAEKFPDPENSQRINGLKNDGKLSVQDVERLKTIASSNPRECLITFNDLKIMRTIDPARFKELTLTGYDAATHKTVYFNADTQANMPIALAARISMSIPIMFKPVIMDVGGEKHKMVDGGVGANLPMEIFHQSVEKPSRGYEDKGLEKTMVFSFDESGQTEKILHSPNEMGKAGLKNRFMGLLTPTRFNEYPTNVKADRAKLYNAGPNAMVVCHGDLGTTEFSANATRIKQAQEEAEKKAIEYMSMREDQAIYKTYTDAKSLVADLSNEEVNSIVEKGEPKGTDFTSTQAYMWQR